VGTVGGGGKSEKTGGKGASLKLGENAFGARGLFGGGRGGRIMKKKSETWEREKIPP